MPGWIAQWLEPYTFLLCACAVATIVAWRSTKWRSLASAIGIAILWLLLALSTPLAGWLALGSLEWWYAPSAIEVQPSDTIVVLSGAQIVEGERARLQCDSIQRCLHAAQLYRAAGRCRMVVSGGKVDWSSPGPTLAETMRDFLQQLGVAPGDIVLEDKSSTTYENARNCSEVLASFENGQVVLVTNAASMLRAERCFLAQHVVVMPSPCDFHSRDLKFSVTTLLPSSSGIQGVNDAAHEWLGLAWYWLRGRI